LVHRFSLRRQKPSVSRQRFAPRGMVRLVLCLCGLVAGTAHAAAEAFQSQAALQQSVRGFLQEQLANRPADSTEIEVGRLDPRLRLKACDTALQPFLPSGARLEGKLSVGVRCPDHRPWTVYLPAWVRIFAKALVTARPLSRGATVDADDIVAVRLEVSKLNRGYYLEPADVIGKILRRSLPTGRALTPHVLRAPLMVRRGDNVIILAESTGLQVRMKGEALQDAARGQRVSVRNLRSKRVVEGTAVEPGLVQVVM
jgi:flagella basal body P-ring formation protein FlgA